MYITLNRQDLTTAKINKILGLTEDREKLTQWLSLQKYVNQAFVISRKNHYEIDALTAFIELEQHFSKEQQQAFVNSIKSELQTTFKNYFLPSTFIFVTGPAKTLSTRRV